jgi:DNA-binding LacI/PurR family transcriptional regulator
MAKRARATVVDVAKAADVAVGTVSRVLNNHADVNADIRARVWNAARTLNYTRIRQRKGRREASERVGNIAVICFGMEDTLVQLPVVSSALQGIESALSQSGRSLMLANIPEGDRVPPFLTEGHVEGVILKGPNQGLLPDEQTSELIQRIYRLPRVWLMGCLPGARGDHCNFDTEAAGRLAAEHLRRMNHRRAAFLNPKPGQTQFEKVRTSFCAAFAELGGEPSVLEVSRPERLAWPLPAITHQDNVDHLVDRWISQPAKTRATALFVPSDRTASQLYSSLERRGVGVGRDLSVISCNNERPLIMGLHPGLTTIDVHAETIGHRAVDQLLWRIAHPHEPLSIQLLIEPTLAERASVAALQPGPRAGGGERIRRGGRAPESGGRFVK